MALHRTSSRDHVTDDPWRVRHSTGVISKARPTGRRVARECREHVERIKAGGRAEALFSISRVVSFCGTTGMQGKVKPEGRAGERKGEKEIDRAIEKVLGGSASLYLAESRAGRCGGHNSQVLC